MSCFSFSRKCSLPHRNSTQTLRNAGSDPSQHYKVRNAASGGPSQQGLTCILTSKKSWLTPQLDKQRIYLEKIINCFRKHRKEKTRNSWYINVSKVGLTHYHLLIRTWLWRASLVLLQPHTRWINRETASELWLVPTLFPKINANPFNIITMALVSQRNHEGVTCILR